MKHHTGSIEIITGSMFCGKTDELIRRLRRASIARQKVQVFKPVIDNCYNVEKVTSHAGSEPMGFGSDLPGPLKLSENQITPPLKMAAPHSLAYFRSKRPPPKNATTARIQLAAIGRAALWQG